MQRKLASNGAPPFPNAKEESLVPSSRWVKSPFSRVGIPLCAEEKSSPPFQEGRRQMQVQICVQGHLNLSWDGRLSIRLMGWLSRSLPDQAALHGIRLPDRLAWSRAAPLA